MSLVGQVILLVEDEPIIAMDIIEMLEDEGATVRGPLRSVKEALIFLADEDKMADIVCAVLDYQLTDGTSERLATTLHARDIPFLLHTANSEMVKSLAKKLRADVVSKPSSEQGLVKAILRMTGIAV